MKRLLSFALALLLLGGCTAHDAGQGVQNHSTTIAVLLKSMGNPHWQEMRSGLQDAASKYGVELILLYPENETDTNQQTMIFRDILEQKPDALLWAPCNSLLGPQMELLAEQAGVPLFTVDTRADNTDAPFIGVDSTLVGTMAAEYLGETFDYAGQFAVIAGPQSQSCHFERAGGFLSTMRQYPNIDIVAIRYTDSNFDSGMEATRDILEVYPDLDGIFCTSAVMALGAVEQVKATFLQNSVQIVTVDTQPDALAAVSNGLISGLITQDGYDIGYKAIETVMDSLSGKDVGQNIYLPIELLTRQNVDDFTEQYLQRRDMHD